jgi:hypothetical protein
MCDIGSLFSMGTSISTEMGITGTESITVMAIRHGEGVMIMRITDTKVVTANGTTLARISFIVPIKKTIEIIGVKGTRAPVIESDVSGSLAVLQINRHPPRQPLAVEDIDIYLNSCLHW